MSVRQVDGIVIGVSAGVVIIKKKNSRNDSQRQDQINEQNDL